MGYASWAVLGVLGLLAIVGVLLWVFRVVLPPLIFAGAIVFILNPVVTRLQRRHVPRAAGTAVAYLCVAGILVLGGFLVSPLFSEQADEFSDEWPVLRQQIYDGVDDWSERSREGNWLVRIPSVNELEDEAANRSQPLSDQLERVREIGLRVFHVALAILLGPIIAFYLLVDLPHLRRTAESLIPAQLRAEVVLVGRRLNHAIGGFFRGQLAVAFIVGVMVSVSLLIVRLPFWLLVGMVAGLFNLIPLVGPWIGALPGVMIALTTRDVGTAVVVVVIMAGVQQIDNHFITPNVMQRTVHLHPSAVMLALLAGGTIGGFYGLLLAVPAVAVLRIIISHLWHTYVLHEPVEGGFTELAAEPPSTELAAAVANDPVATDQ